MKKMIIIVRKMLYDTRNL